MNYMTKLEQKLIRDIQNAREFVFTLITKLPKKTLNDERTHIYRGNEDLGTMKEFINKNLEEIKEILGNEKNSKFNFISIMYV